jgi:hypothetical protein
MADSHLQVQLQTEHTLGLERFNTRNPPHKGGTENEIYSFGNPN